MYKRTDAEGLELCAGFKQTYCRAVTIDFMGVWDTVASVGVIMGRTLPFTNSNSSIKTFRHALSLDEHRAKFRPNNYHRPAPSIQAARLDPENASLNLDSKDDSGSTSGEGTAAEKKKKRWGFLGKRRAAEKARKTVATESALGESDDVLEVWFSGCHSDVGGGAVANDTKENLANITLRWMVREAFASESGIQFDYAALVRANIALGLEPTAAELDMDNVDALQPIHDELKIDPLWWLLEIIPLQFSWQDADGVWHRDWNFHLGRGRDIVDPQPNFHVTVKTRMSSALKYTPKAKWKAGTEVYLH
jgi:hypothetical protein